MRFIYIFILVLPLLGMAQLVKDDDPQLMRINVDEQLGSNIPLDVVLYDEQGNMVKLEHFFDGQQPVVFVFAYYECPMLCTLVLNGLNDAINAMDWPADQRYRIVTVSIDSSEMPPLAQKKKNTYTANSADSSLKTRWHFLTADQQTIDTLTNAMGFKYFYDEERDEFAHPAVLYLLSPNGKIARHLYGIKFNPSDLKLGLLEASDGKVGSTIERLLLYCYHYDEDANSYVLFAWNVMKLGGVLTIAILGLFLGTLWFREKRKIKTA